MPLSKHDADAIHRMPFVRACLLAYHDRPADEEARAIVWAIADQIENLRESAGRTLPPAGERGQA